MVTIAGGVCGALGLVVLAGWYTHNVTLVRVVPAFAPMQYSEALCFLVGGVSLLALICRLPRLAAVGGMVIAVIGLMTLSEYLFNIHLGINPFPMPSALTVDASQLERMAPNTALSFSLLGVSLLIMSRASPRKQPLLLIGPLGAIVFALGLAACIGYLTGLAMYNWEQATLMAAHTAVGLIVLGSGVIAHAWQVDGAKEEGRSRRLPILIGVAVLATTLCLWQALIANERALIEQALTIVAASVHNEFITQTESRILALTSLAKRWEQWGKPSKDEWTTAAELYVQHYPGFQAIAWVDASKYVRWLVPAARNEAMQGLYLAFEEQRRQALELAQGSRQVTATRVFELIQGGQGFHVYIPIFQGERFDGYIVGVFRVQELLDTIFGNVAGGYALAVFVGETQVYSRQHASDRPEAGWSQEVAVGLHGVTWRLQLWPTPALLVIVRSALPEVILVVGLLTAVLLAAAVHFAQISRRRAVQVNAANRELQTEIVERKRIEDALRESERRYRSVTQSANEAIITADSEGTIVAWNKGAETTFGYIEAEILGQSLTLLMPASYRNQHQHGIKRLQDTGASRIIGKTREFRGLRKDGSEFPLELSLAQWEAGQSIFYSGIIRDLTERKRVERELQRQQEALYQREKLAAMGTLLASVTHELNNPLAVVMMEVDLLSEEVEDSSLAARTQKILQAAQRCVRIIQNFLALVRERSPERTPVQLNTVVEAAVDMLAYPLQVDNIAVYLHLADKLPVLAADANQLQQVLLNLVTNAHQALRETPLPRQLTITTRCDATGMRVTLEVADTGPGIPPDMQARVFEPFFTTKPPGVGTGLGLPLCQGIIESHGGTMTVESQPGRGTTFRIELPVATMPMPSPSAAPRTEDLRSVEGKAILVVDDEPGITSALAYLLRRNRHEVETAANGRIALQKLQQRAYDLILSDIRMPELDGPGFYQELEHHYPQLLKRIIFLTGDTLSPETKAFLEQASVPRLSKPFTATEVRQVVQRALQTV
jgi:two-component system NtrC family sensor kinase